jgi:hypothetical protein
MYNNRVQHVLGMANTHTQDFNCWGATMFIAHGQDHLEWVENDAMGEWLTSNYTPIAKSKHQEGDIVALFSPDMRLVHTAYCVERGRYVHKIGQNVARLETLNGVLKTYARQAERYIFLRRNELCV